MGTVVDEGLLVAERPGHAADLITPGHAVETCFYLRGKVRKRKRERMESTYDWLVHLSNGPIRRGPDLHVRPVVEEVEEGSQGVNIGPGERVVGRVGHEDGARVDTTPRPPGGGVITIYVHTHTHIYIYIYIYTYI